MTRKQFPTEAKRRFAGGITGLGSILILALSASPAAGTTVVQGYECSGPGWVSEIAAAEACLLKVQVSHSAGTFSPRAFDKAADGYSALNESRIQQFINGRWVQSKRVVVVNSSGAGKTAIGNSFRVQRLRQGNVQASHIKIIITACTYDSPTQVRIQCGTTTRTLRW